MFSLDIAVIAAMQLQNVHVLTLDVQCAASITKADKPSSSSTDNQLVLSGRRHSCVLWDSKYRTVVSYPYRVSQGESPASDHVEAGG